MRVIEPFKQFFDGAGDPLVNGWLLFLESGSADTQKDTYFDSSETILNTNPLQLDAEGRCPNVFGTGVYKVILYTNDELLNQPSFQVDVKDPVGGTTGIEDFTDWVANGTYGEGNYVKYEDEFYKSLVPDNENNIPSSSSEFWEQVKFVKVYNPNITYAENDTILEPSSNRFFGLSSGTSLGNTPSESSVDWVPDVRTESITFSVGLGEDFDTINKGLEFLTKSQHQYKQSGLDIVLQLSAGFVMEEQVIVEQIDLSWITISSVDAETTIDPAAITVGTIPAAFMANSYGTLPVISSLFSYGVANSKYGCYCSGRGSVQFTNGAGIKDAGAAGLYLDEFSNGDIGQTIFSGAGTYGAWFRRGSWGNLRGAVLDNALITGLYLQEGAIANANDVSAKNCTSYGIHVLEGSYSNSHGSDFSGAGTFGILVQNTGVVEASSVTGTLSQAANVWTASGWIGQ